MGHPGLFFFAHRWLANQPTFNQPGCPYRPGRDFSGVDHAAKSPDLMVAPAGRGESATAWRGRVETDAPERRKRGGGDDGRRRRKDECR